MQRSWLAHYPAGVPAEVDIGQYPSVVALIEESFQKYRNDKAYILMDKALTYGEIDRLSRDLAAYLQGLGLKKGDRVAIMMPNVLQYPVAVAAVMRAGFIVVNVNPLYTPRELEHQLKDCGAQAIIILENFATTLEQVVRQTPLKHVVVASIGDLLGFPKGAMVNLVMRRVRKAVPAWSLPGAVKFNAAVAAGRRKPLDKPEIGPDDVAVLQYTGGTTGVSKGATLLHRTIISNLLASEAWMRPGMTRKPTEGPAHLHLRTAALPRLRLHHLRAARHAHRRCQRADPQPARHSRHREGDRQVQVPHHAGRQHAVQRARQQCRIRQA